MIVEVSKIPKRNKIVDAPTDNLEELFEVFKTMERICNENGGIGLSAVQIGIPWKIFVIKGDGTGKIPKGSFWNFVNCEYSSIGIETMKSVEGCLSIKDQNGHCIRYEVNRFPIVSVCGKRLINGKEKGLFIHPYKDTIAAFEQGIVFQHEIDHHRGRLISDFGKLLNGTN